MAGAGVEFEAIKLLQLCDAGQGLLLEGAFAIEGMEHDALKQVTQGEIAILGKGFQHLQQPLLDAYAGLHSFDEQFAIG